MKYWQNYLGGHQENKNWKKLTKKKKGSNNRSSVRAGQNIFSPAKIPTSDWNMRYDALKSKINEKSTQM